jgi:hypothetical protein
MNIPAKYRTVLYWIVLVATVVFGVLSGMGLVPQDAVVKGTESVVAILVVISQILALLNIKPDAPRE